MIEAIAIDPERLNRVRRARKFGRPQLAKAAGLTERVVARLEGAAPMTGTLPHDLLCRISAVLQVAPEILSGKAPLAEADLLPLERASACRTGCCG